MSFVTVNPLYKVNDWEKIRALMNEGLELVKGEAGTLSFAFFVTEDTIQISAYFVDGAAVVAHLDNTSGLLARVLDGPAELKEMRITGITGPKDQLELIKPMADPLGAVYFETMKGGISKMKGVASEPKPAEIFVIYPIFKVNDWSKCEEEFIKPLLEKVQSEEGCLNYSFAKTEDRLICIERYISADAGMIHLANAGSILGTATASGILDLEYLGILASADDLEKVKETFDPFAPEYKALFCGFEKHCV